MAAETRDILPGLPLPPTPTVPAKRLPFRRRRQRLRSHQPPPHLCPSEGGPTVSVCLRAEACRAPAGNVSGKPGQAGLPSQPPSKPKSLSILLRLCSSFVSPSLRRSHTHLPPGRPPCLPQLRGAAEMAQWGWECREPPICSQWVQGQPVIGRTVSLNLPSQPKQFPLTK